MGRAVKVNRLELIEKIRVMIQEREDRAETRRLDAIARALTAEADYLALYTEDWKLFADRIRRRLRQGEAPRTEDIPEGLRNGWKDGAVVFRKPVVRASDYAPKVEAHHRLIAVLEASPDEFVTTTTLDRIGAPLRELMKP